MHSALTVNSMSSPIGGGPSPTDLIMSAVQGVPVTAQAGVGSSVVLPADQNGTSGVNPASIPMHEAMTVQQVSNPQVVANLQKQQNHNSQNRSKSQNSVKNNDNSAAGGMCDEKTVEYLRDLIEERKTIENNNIEEIQEIGGNGGSAYCKPEQCE